MPTIHAHTRANNDFMIRPLNRQANSQFNRQIQRDPVYLKENMIEQEEEEEEDDDDDNENQKQEH